MRLHWIFFIVIFYLFCFHSNGNHTVVNRNWRKVPIVLLFANDAKRNALTPKEAPKTPTPGNTEEGSDDPGLALHMVVHDVDKHLDYSATADHHGKEKYANDTTVIEYIPEEDDPVHKTRRVKRHGQYGGHHGGYHQHGGYHHQPVHHRPPPPPPKKPVSLDFGCNADNHHVHITKQHDGSAESDRTTSNPSSSSSSSDNDKLLSLFIRRPQHLMRPHHHGPHITFRCNANNHHIFKHFRRSSK